MDQKFVCIIENRESGLSMIELIVSLGIFAILIGGAATQIKLVYQTADSLNYDVDLVNIASDLRSRTNCPRTTSDLRASFGGALPPPGTSVTLRRSNGREVLGVRGPASTPLQDASSFGDGWWVKATWALTGIEIRLAKTKSDGAFALRPSDRTPLDFNVPKHNIFRHSPLCADLNIRSYAIDLITSNSTEASTLMGIPNPHTSYIEPISKIPIGMTQVCHRMCRENSPARNFVSGWMVGISDMDLVVDPVTGEYSDQRRAPGDGVVICRCLR